AVRRPRQLLEQMGGAKAKVVFAVDAGKPDRAVVAQPDADAIRAIDQAEHRLQLVVARVLAATALAEHVQEEVQLPRRGIPLHCCIDFHSEITRRSSMSG